MQWWTAQQLKSKNPEARLEAVEKLTAEASPQAFRSIIGVASDPETRIRLSVMRAMGGCREPEGMTVLFNGLHDKVDVVREAAVMSLRRIGDITTIEHLLPLLEDSHAGVRWHAVKTLERFGWQPRTDQERMLRDVAVGDYISAAQAGFPALEMLTKSLTDSSFTNRRAVAEALGELGGDKVAGPLVAALADREAAVRTAAIESLTQVRDPRAVEPLKACLKDKEATVRAAAAVGLGVLGGASVVSVLTKVIKDPHWSVRKAAVGALASLKETSAVPALIPMLKDPDHDVRETACATLTKLGDRRAIAPLIVALADAQSSVRHAAACALRDIAPEWERASEALAAIPELRAACKDREYWVRHAARDAMQRIDSAAQNAPVFEPLNEKLNVAVDVLMLALKHSERDFRQAAAEALGRLGNPQIANLLMPALHDSDRWVCQSVAQALRQTGCEIDMASPAQHAA
jgi:HEAT repeat protein